MAQYLTFSHHTQCVTLTLTFKSSLDLSLQHQDCQTEEEGEEGDQLLDNVSIYPGAGQLESLHSLSLSLSLRGRINTRAGLEAASHTASSEGVAGGVAARLTADPGLALE